MKTLFVSLLLVGTVSMQSLTMAKPTNPRKAPKRSLEQQLSNYISYPEVLKESNREGVVVIQFEVSEDSRVQKLKVLSENEQLNASLLKQLTGRKLDVLPTDTNQMQTVRLRFQID